MVTYYLRDIDENIVRAWGEEFSTIDSVDVSGGDIFDLEADAIVSPANSFGYMDGGIDLVYLNRFGWQLQGRLQDHLKEHHHGELPVGQAVILNTQDATIPFLVSAPTMRVPMTIANTVNSYLAFRAVIRAVAQHNRAGRQAIRKVLCPGLGTAIGNMPAARAARQMAAAYRVCVQGEVITPASHDKLLGE